MHSLNHLQTPGDIQARCRAALQDTLQGMYAPQLQSCPLFDLDATDDEDDWYCSEWVEDPTSSTDKQVGLCLHSDCGTTLLSLQGSG